MSAKIIYKDAQTEQRLKAARAKGKTVYINFDALAELPDEFEAAVSEIVFDPKKLDELFSHIGNGNYMPKPELVYEIAEARGIGGMKDKSGIPIPAQVEPIIEEVDINPMLCKSIESEPLMRKMICGRRVTKSSEVLQEDGIYRPSGACTVDYNAWERCTKLWSAEEKDTEGYTKQATYPDGNVIKYKYDTKLKRRAHFDEMLMFANAQAQTKSHEKTIRELACLPTGYKKDDLADGVLFFVKIRRSSMVLKMETAARLEAIRNGGNAPRIEAVNPSIQKHIDITPSPEPTPEPEIFGTFETPTEPEPELDPRRLPVVERLAYVYEKYLEDGHVPESRIDLVKKMVAWLKDTPDADKKEAWKTQINNLRALENLIPELGRVQHGLY